MPELVVTCKKQWDLFVNRFNLVQRGKESKLVGKENKTCLIFWHNSYQAK